MELKRISFRSEINYNSYNYIVFSKNLAYSYMNTGLLSNVFRARVILSEAIKNFEMGNFSSPEQYSTYFQLQLLMALSHEFFNEHDKAFQRYEYNLNEIEAKYSFVDEVTTNLFRRMMYIIAPENALKKKIEDYSGMNIAATYQNKRRFLEKDIYAGRANDEQIVELNNLFNSIKNAIDKLFHVTHFRLLYTYYGRRGNVKLATKFFQTAMDMAYNYEFMGQVQRLNLLRSSIEE